MLFELGWAFVDTLLAWLIRFCKWIYDRLRTDMENDEWERASARNRPTERF